MEYYNGHLCISAHDLVASGFLSPASYKRLAHLHHIQVVRRGSRGHSALVAVSSLPMKCRDQIEARYGRGNAELLRGWILSNYQLDQKAVAFFNDWAAAQRSNSATPQLALHYAVNASVLNTCISLFQNARQRKRLMGETYQWEQMSAAIETLRAETGHDLPASPIRFRKKVNLYQRLGYAALLSGKFSNQSARKVNFQTERLILAIARQDNKPFNATVHDMYLQFVTGELDIYDPETGELYNPDDFSNANGDPLELSETTITNILNKPNNKLLVHAAQDSFVTFMHEQMPHMHRHTGQFSLSQITMDDVDLTRKLTDSRLRVHAYYAYDVVSQCVVGAAYSRKKDQALVVECFRDMFRLCQRHNWGIPAGIEVENHLMTEYRDGFLKAGQVFSFVRFCAPQNSQEKYAEQMNGAKKRAIIHKNHRGIGRFYGKGKWRVEARKISDETNDTWEDNEYFTFDELVADDRGDSLEWNNSLHPNQKRYPGMTRWQVLEANINPNLQPMQPLTLARYIGCAVQTSVRRNSTVRVGYRDWWLSSPQVLERLEPNNFQLTAYYLPDEDGQYSTIYLFQGNRYIDTPSPVETFNRVMAEQTPADRQRFTEQQKRVAQFRAYVQNNAIPKLNIAKPNNNTDYDNTTTEPLALPQPQPTADNHYIIPDALDSL